MNRHTRIRIWDAVSGDNGEYLAEEGSTVTSFSMEAAVSMGVPGTHPSSCDWDIEFSTGHEDEAGTPIFQGDIIVDDEWAYVIRFGEAECPFADTREGVDDICGTFLGFYCEPLEPEAVAKLDNGPKYPQQDKHNRAFSTEMKNIQVVANIRQRPELAEE